MAKSLKQRLEELNELQENFSASKGGPGHQKALWDAVVKLRAVQDETEKKLQKELDKTEPNAATVATLSGQCADIITAIKIAEKTMEKNRELSPKEKNDAPLGHLQLLNDRKASALSSGQAQPTDIFDAVMRLELEKRVFGGRLTEAADKLSGMESTLRASCQVDPTKPVVRDLNQEKALREYGETKAENTLNVLKSRPGYTAAKGELAFESTNDALKAATVDADQALKRYQETKSDRHLDSYMKKSADVALLQAEQQGFKTLLKNERGAEMATDIAQKVDIDALLREDNSYGKGGREAVGASLRAQLNTPVDRYDVKLIEAAENNTLFIITDKTNPEAKVAFKISVIESRLASTNVDFTQAQDNLARAPTAGKLYNVTSIPNVNSDGETGVVEMSEYIGGKNMQARHHEYAMTHYTEGQEPSKMTLLNHQLMVLNDAQVLIDHQMGFKAAGLVNPDLKPRNLLRDYGNADKQSDVKTVAAPENLSEFVLPPKKYQPFLCTYNRTPLTISETGGVRTYSFDKQDQINLGLSTLSLLSENGNADINKVVPYVERDQVKIDGKVISEANGQTPAGIVDVLAQTIPHLRTDTGKKIYEINNGLMNCTTTIDVAEKAMNAVRTEVMAAIEVEAKKSPLPYKTEIDQARVAVKEVTEVAGKSAGEDLRTTILTDPVVAAKVHNFKGDVQDFGSAVAKATACTSEYRTAATNTQLTEYKREYDAVKATPALVQQLLGDTLDATKDTVFAAKNDTMLPNTGQAKTTVLDAGLETPRADLPISGEANAKTLEAGMNSARYDAADIPGLRVQPNKAVAEKAAAAVAAEKEQRAEKQEQKSARQEQAQPIDPVAGNDENLRGLGK